MTHICLKSQATVFEEFAAFERLAVAVVLVTPELMIARANAAARALLARIEPAEPRETRLSRSVGTNACLANTPAQSAALRAFLGLPTSGPRRSNVTFGGIDFEVGVAPCFESNGAWIGWLVDAIATTAPSQRSGHERTLPFGVIAVDAAGRMIEINAAAHAVLTEAGNFLPGDVPLESGVALAGIFPEVSARRLPRTPFRFERALAPQKTLTGMWAPGPRDTGGILTLSILERPIEKDVIAAIEEEASQLILAALTTLEGVQQLNSNITNAPSRDLEPAGIV